MTLKSNMEEDWKAISAEMGVTSTRDRDIFEAGYRAMARRLYQDVDGSDTHGARRATHGLFNGKWHMLRHPAYPHAVAALPGGQHVLYTTFTRLIRRAAIEPADVIDAEV